MPPAIWRRAWPRRSHGTAALPRRSSENFECSRARHRWNERCRGLDRAAGELRLDACDPPVRAFVQLEVLGHEPAAGDEDAEIGTFVAEVSWPADAQEEGLALAAHRPAMIVEAGIGYAVVGLEAPDA